MTLSDSIYYADDRVLQMVERDLELIERAPWYELYESRADRSLWRLDETDKYQERFLVRVDSKTGWPDFDAHQLQIALLERTRGVGDERCSIKDCERLALNKLAYCAIHAHGTGIRR